MRILFIDDAPSRLGTLNAMLAGAGIAAEVLHRKHVADVRLPDDVAWADVVFFDFDLCAGDAESGEPCPSTGSDTDCDCPNGLELGRRIFAAACPARRAVIHSATWSRDKRDELARLLAGAGWPVHVEPIIYWRDTVPAVLARRLLGLAA